VIELSAQWAAALVALAGFGFAVYGLLARSAMAKLKAFDRHLDEGAKLMAALKAGLQMVERELSHMPDKETTHRLELAITALSGRMQTLEERIKPIAAQAERLHDAWLHGEHK
jgi:hypothetical protein